MQLTPDQVVLLTVGSLSINATLVFSWITMAVLAGGAAAITHGVRRGGEGGRGYHLVEMVVLFFRDQIREAAGGAPDRYLAFVSTLFLFIATPSVLGLIPGFRTPMASLSTTVALALCVLAAVPAFGIARLGVGRYLRGYVEPNVLMLPFNILGELTRTLSLAARLFGNMMSGELLVGIVFSLVPFFFPLVLQAFGLLIGMIQAYVFALLALVYILSGSRAHPLQADPQSGSAGESWPPISSIT